MDRGYRLVAAVVAVALVLGGAAGALLLSGAVGDSSARVAQAYGHSYDRGLSVNGEGQISLTPDVARVLLGVEVEGTDLDDLRDDADSRMNDVIDALIDLGIAEEDIRTIAYDIRIRDERVDPPRPHTAPAIPDEPDADEEPVTDEDATEEDEATEEEMVPDDEEVTYVLEQLIQVRITDIDIVGEVIDTALDSGANRVGNISFEVDDRGEAIDQARELAVSEARAKAEHLAELTGVSLGAPLQIDEHSPSAAPVRMDEFAMDAEMEVEEAGIARIEPGETVITVWVNITYAID